MRRHPLFDEFEPYLVAPTPNHLAAPARAALAQQKDDLIRNFLRIIRENTCAFFRDVQQSAFEWRGPVGNIHLNGISHELTGVPALFGSHNSERTW
jgi:hypothetical protein